MYIYIDTYSKQLMQSSQEQTMCAFSLFSFSIFINTDEYLFHFISTYNIYNVYIIYIICIDAADEDLY